MKAHIERQKAKEDRVFKEIKIQRIKQEIASELVAKFPWTESRLSCQKIKLMELKDLYKV